MTRALREKRRIVVVQSSEAAHHPRHHYRLAGTLHEAGYRVEMLAQRDRSGEHVDAVPTTYLPDRGSRLARMATGPLTMWRATAGRPDAVLTVSLDLLPWAVLGRRWRCPVMVFDSNEEYHDDMLQRAYLPQAVRPALSKLVLRGEPWLASLLNAATTAVPATQEKYLAGGVESVLVRNFPPLSVMADVERTRPFAHEVMFGGVLEKDMVLTICETATRLDALLSRRATWLVAARQYGPEDIEFLETTLAEHGLREQFTLRYNVPFTEMPDILSSAAVGFVFFNGVAAPQRIFEYMACGIPFVGCDRPWMSDYLRGRDVALLADPDPEAYAGALARLLSDEDLQRKMSVKGPPLAGGEYNWESESRKLIGLFDSLMDIPSDEADHLRALGAQSG